MESNALYGDFKIKLVWRLSDNLIYHVFSRKENSRQITPVLLINCSRVYRSKV